MILHEMRRARQFVFALVLLAIIFSLMALSPNQLVHAQEKLSGQTVTNTINFPVIQQDWRTGIYVPGGLVTIAASGVASVSLNGTGTPGGDHPCVAQDQQGLLYPLPGGTCNALVGKIGTNGKYFQIGSGGTFTLPTGSLILTVNQYTHRYDDPNGYWAVTVSFKVTNQTLKSTNFAGYAATGTLANPIVYKSVNAVWHVSSVRCGFTETSRSAVWSGLGDNKKDLEQIGTASSCSNGVPLYYGIWEVIQNAHALGGHRIWTLPIFPGNQVEARVTSYGFGEFGLDLWNLSLGLHWGRVVSGDNSSKATRLAECIEEDPTGANGLYPLSHFSTVSIGCSANNLPIGLAGTTLEKFTMNMKYTKATTGSLSYNDTFVSKWVAA